jgi:hypothetical protein
MNSKTAAITATVMLLLSASACSALGGEPAAPLPGTSSAPPATDPSSAAAPTSDPTASDAPASDAPSDGTSPAEPDGSVSASSAPSSSDAAGSTEPTPADPNQPSAGNQLGAPVATRIASAKGKKITMVLYPIRRAATTSTVNFSLSSPGENSLDQVQVAQLLADGDYSAIDFQGHSADGVQLVDGRNAKLYLAASDGKGRCVCSRDLSGVFLRNDTPVLISVTFAAPPANVTTVDVRVPNFGTVSNVPIQ